MEIIKNLIARFWPMGGLFLGGFLLIIYIALGFLYLQQGAQQREITGQIAKLSAVVSRPMPSGEELQAEYEEVNRSLAPMTDSDAIEMLVGIAGESGIDIDEASSKLRVPSARVGKMKVGEGNYQILSFGNIIVEGNCDNVTAFISNLDSGKTLKTMVLKSLTTSTSQTENKTTATLNVDIYTKPGE